MLIVLVKCHQQLLGGQHDGLCLSGSLPIIFVISFFTCSFVTLHINCLSHWERWC